MAQECSVEKPCRDLSPELPEVVLRVLPSPALPVAHRHRAEEAVGRFERRIGPRGAEALEAVDGAGEVRAEVRRTAAERVRVVARAGPEAVRPAQRRRPQGGAPF